MVAGGVDDRAEPLAHVLRSGVVESVHHGHVVAVDAGGMAVVALGNPNVTFFPRSSLKPLQAVGMVRAGLDLPGELLALAAASHSGEAAHLAGVSRILAGAGLTADDLQNTPDLPLDPDVAARWRIENRPPARIAQNCSGKHAAMLATCVRAGWDTARYRDPAHPLQRALAATVVELTGVPVEHVAVDGCGAPLFSSTPAGLARALAQIATAPPDSPEGRVAGAMREHPWWVAGTGRTVTRLCAAVPALIAKDGAEGVFGAALPDGRVVVLKVLDGSARPVAAVVAAALRALGVDTAVLDAPDHGTPDRGTGAHDARVATIAPVEALVRLPAAG